MNRLDARFVKARDARLAEPEHFAHLTLRQTIDVHQAQHLALLRVGKQLDRGSHRVFLEPVADGCERIPVEFVRSVVNPVRVASRQGSRFPIAVRFVQRAPEHSLLGLSGSSPEVHVRDLRVYCPQVARLARLASRKSHHLVTRPTFGLRTREVARASNLNREKGWEN